MAVFPRDAVPGQRVPQRGFDQLEITADTLEPVDGHRRALLAIPKDNLDLGRHNLERGTAAKLFLDAVPARLKDLLLRHLGQPMQRRDFDPLADQTEELAHLIGRHDGDGVHTAVEGLHRARDAVVLDLHCHEGVLGRCYRRSDLFGRRPIDRSFVLQEVVDAVHRLFHRLEGGLVAAAGLDQPEHAVLHDIELLAGVADGVERSNPGQILVRNGELDPVGGGRKRGKGDRGALCNVHEGKALVKLNRHIACRPSRGVLGVVMRTIVSLNQSPPFGKLRFDRSATVLEARGRSAGRDSCVGWDGWNRGSIFFCSPAVEDL
mmetsp:Transcript_22195/g.57903  ORF Transcript_22195/g.57903 Transcript_22195/m.57903 type:complete len:320 (+) Transcript_22195:768-1727(+)